MTTGIYAIRNTHAPGCYIGLSVNIEQRLATHLQKLLDGRHDNRNLQTAWDKHDGENFSFMIVEICEEVRTPEAYDWLSAREEHWINLVGTYNINLPKGSHSYLLKVFRLVFRQSVFEKAISIDTGLLVTIKLPWYLVR